MSMPSDPSFRGVRIEAREGVLLLLLTLLCWAPTSDADRRCLTLAQAQINALGIQLLEEPTAANQEGVQSLPLAAQPQVTAHLSQGLHTMFRHVTCGI